jgi:hypothetical protein
MIPVKDPTNYIVGYQYTGPRGEKIPIGLDEAIWLRRPDPTDLYGAISPVSTVLDDIDSVRYAGTWNKNFFLNSAQPGGVIEIEQALTDTEFRIWQTRWAEQHKGVAAAHRVALLERGAKWVDRTTSHKDMDFVAGRDNAREVIRESWGFPKPLLGTVEDVNRANADAAELLFSRWLVTPRLDRIKQALDNHLLPLYGDDDRLRFCYIDPTPEDEAVENAERDSKVAALKILVNDMGYDSDEILAWLDFPIFAPPEKPEPPAPPPPPGSAPDAGENTGDMVDQLTRAVQAELVTAHEARAILRRAGVQLGALTPHTHTHDLVGLPAMTNRFRAAVDIPVELQQLEAAMDNLLTQATGRYSTVREQQIDELLGKIEQCLAEDDIEALPDLTVDDDESMVLIAAAMTAIAVAASGFLVAEAHRQGVTIESGKPNDTLITERSTFDANLLSKQLVMSGTSETMRLRGPSTSGAPVITTERLLSEVRAHLTDLSTRSFEDRVGGSMWCSANDTRFSMLERAPVGKYVATEVLDANTCDPCREVDGRVMTLDEARELYPGGGYFDCDGGVRCRGTIIAVWVDDTEPEPEEG